MFKHTNRRTVVVDQQHFYLITVHIFLNKFDSPRFIRSQIETLKRSENVEMGYHGRKINIVEC